MYHPCLGTRWEHTRAQLAQETGIMVNFQSSTYSLTRARTSDDLSTSEANAFLTQEVNHFLERLEEVLPGAQTNFTFQTVGGRIANAVCMAWIEKPWQRGAYSYWRNGMYLGGQAIAGPGGVPVPAGGTVPYAGFEGIAEPYSEPNVADRNCHFGGEHTQFDDQGYLDVSWYFLCQVCCSIMT